jgi:transaldolase
MAAKAGATYVSPFVGRLDDLSQEGMQLIEQIADIFSNYAYETEIIVASIRNPLHVLDQRIDRGRHRHHSLQCAKAKLAGHPLTDKGIQSFLDDWNKARR